MKNILFIFLNILLIGFTNNTYCQMNLIPKPQGIKITDDYYTISGNTHFTSVNVDDDLKNYLRNYLTKLYGIKFSETQSENKSQIKIILDEKFANKNPEAYSLIIAANNITITSSNEAGLFYGIQTLLQLLPKNISKNEAIKIQSCEIFDHPQFSWRGLNLDCARHFMTKDFIKRYIDILAYYKFNTFHWHLTEDQGWRIEIKKYPKLTEIGAWRKEADGSVYGGYYTQDDIKEIVAYAKSRFINIVPEIEMPGHSLAALASYPENSCTGGPFEVTNIWGVHKDVYCAGRDSTFIFLQNILDEVIDLFPGKYIHIGGDEVPKDRWHKCPECQARIKAEGLKDEHELQSYFIKRISNYLHLKGREVIGWDEILQGGLAPGAIVQSWQSFQGAIDAAKLGHYTICSPASHTYLNSDPENLDLRIAYSFNPIPDELSIEERKYILGSEVNLWTEHAPQETVDSKLFPRILALAEVFWSSPKNKNYDEFYSRVKKTYSDLSAAGIKYGQESKLINYSTFYNNKAKEFIVSITPAQPDIVIRYSLDEQKPDSNSYLYTEPIKINKSLKLRVAAMLNDYFIGKELDFSFDFHKALNSKISLINRYDERYRASGDDALIDGVRGTKNFRDGLWQGFEGVDFEAIIDLGERLDISKVSPRFILNSNSWIFLPEYVDISLSDDGKNFSNKIKIMNDTPQKNSDIVLKDFQVEYNKVKARYIKVRAKNIGVCPDWHPGAGGKAWLFIDEIMVE